MPARETLPASQNERIVALDLIRGYLIIIIASAHLAYYPSLLGSFDGRGQLWVSDAEGFFLISGLLIGLIRGRQMLRSGLAAASRKVVARGLKLYVTVTVLTVLYLLWGWAMQTVNPAAVKSGLYAGSDWVNLAWQIVSGQYSYGWTDFLAFYAAFLLITPLVLMALRRGWWWLVLGVSVAAWIWRWGGGYPPYNSYFQWQIYFFVGTIIGYHWNALTAWFARMRSGGRRVIKLAAVVGAAVITVLGALVVFGSQAAAHPALAWTTAINDNYWYNRMLIDARHGLLRPLATMVVLGGAYVLVRRYEAQIVRWAGWLLLPFGRNSLYAYIMEGFILFAIPFYIAAGGFFLNTAIELGLVMIVWVMIRQRFLFRLVPR